MDWDKRLRDIGLELETFQAHIKRMRKKESIHSLDLDLLMDKTRKLYEQLILLRPEGEDVPNDRVERTIELPEKMPEGELPEKARSKQTGHSEAISGRTEMEVTSEKSASAAKVASTEASPPPRESRETMVSADPEQKNEKQTGSPSASEPSESDDPPAKPAPEEDGEKQKSTFDLFSASAGDTIGDKLSDTEQSSIAEQMQQSTISDLKQAIGINEKFLFINELFNGDLGKYNKVIEEFNSLQTEAGVQAYLVELKVQHQWDEKSETFLKLKSLLERKFG